MAKFEWNGLRMRCYRVVHSSATPASRLVHSRSGLSVRMLDSVVLSSQYYTIIISAKQEDLATFQTRTTFLTPPEKYKYPGHMKGYRRTRLIGFKVFRIGWARLQTWTRMRRSGVHIPAPPAPTLPLFST